MGVTVFIEIGRIILGKVIFEIGLMRKVMPRGPGEINLARFFTTHALV